MAGEAFDSQIQILKYVLQTKCDGGNLNDASIICFIADSWRSITVHVFVMVILKILFQEEFSEHIIRNYEAKQGFRSCNFAKIQNFVQIHNCNDQTTILPGHSLGKFDLQYFFH